MSYDLTLFRVPDGGDALLSYRKLRKNDEANAADLDGWKNQPISAPVRAEMRRIADALKSWRPELEEFVPNGTLPWIELNDPDLSIQFAVQSDHVDVTMPYFGREAPEMMECVTGSFSLLNRVAGLIAYDPQLDRIVTAADLNDMIGHYQAVDDALPGMLEQLNQQSPAELARPWWKFW